MCMCKCQEMVFVKSVYIYIYIWNKFCGIVRPHQTGHDALLFRISIKRDGRARQGPRPYDTGVLAGPPARLTHDMSQVI